MDLITFGLGFITGAIISFLVTIIVGIILIKKDEMRKSK